jgi:hypothetical protein
VCELSSGSSPGLCCVTSATAEGDSPPTKFSVRAEFRELPLDSALVTSATATGDFQPTVTARMEVLGCKDGSGVRSTRQHERLGPKVHLPSAKLAARSASAKLDRGDFGRCSLPRSAASDLASSCQYKRTRFIKVAAASGFPRSAGAPSPSTLSDAVPRCRQSSEQGAQGIVHLVESLVELLEGHRIHLLRQAVLRSEIRRGSNMHLCPVVLHSNSP